MAIIENVLFEKASGSVDNITYYMLNGQLIARFRNRAPYDPKTPAQLAQRNKISNAVFGYTYMKDWLQFIAPMVVAPRTLYNTYTSLFIPYYPNTKVMTLNELLSYLASSSIGSSNYCTITNFNLVGLNLTVDFTTDGSAYQLGTTIRIIATSDISENYQIYIVSVSEENWLSGQFEVLLSVNMVSTLGMYICASSANKCSNIKF